MKDFEQTISAAYGFAAPSIEFGHVTREGGVFANLPVRIPLGVMNRHGLIAGSTGTGKTRTLQLLAEGLSRAGVPVVLGDVKGDLAGLGKPGELNDKIRQRLQSVGREFHPESFPVEFFSLTGNRGVQLRATVSSFGPVLLAKVLDLSETQQSVLALVFKYCDDRRLPLLDLKDLREVLNYLANEGKQDLKQYGGMSSATVGVLLRKMVELEQQGAERFFGEPELEIQDLMRLAPDGRGVLNIVDLADVQDKPRLFSTFLMWLLGRFYYGMPEVGDPDKPKLVFFFDEAHLLFNDASSALEEHVEQVARLIRSKGIGVFFITQMPGDVDEDVLAQLGSRFQHGVRAFTPKDAKNLRAAASTYPSTEFYTVDKTLTSLGTGEALTTVLNPKGVPTEVVTAQILAPSSSMKALEDDERRHLIAQSVLAPKYAHAIDRESAHEILRRQLEELEQQDLEEQRMREEREWAKRVPRAPAPVSISTPRASTPRRSTRVPKTVAEQVLGSTAARQVARTVTTELVRGIFGILRRK